LQEASNLKESVYKSYDELPLFLKAEKKITTYDQQEECPA
jgi:hypothetical protein